MLRQICVCKFQLIFDPPLGDLTAFARLATKLLRYEVELDWKFSKLLLNRKGLNFSQARKVMRNCNPPTLQKHSILSFTDATTMSTYLLVIMILLEMKKRKTLLASKSDAAPRVFSHLLQHFFKPFWLLFMAGNLYEPFIRQSFNPCTDVSQHSIIHCHPIKCFSAMNGNYFDALSLRTSIANIQTFPSQYIVSKAQQAPFFGSFVKRLRCVILPVKKYHQRWR